MPRSIVDIPLRAGLQQKTSEPWLDPSAQPLASNAIWVLANAVEKRPGYLNALAPTIIYPPAVLGYDFTWGATSLAFGVGLLPSAGGFAESDGFYVYSQNAAQGVNEWLDFVPPCVATRKTIASTNASAFNPTVANWNGQNLYVWQGETSGYTGYGDQLFFALVDEASGATICSGPVGEVTVNQGRAPRLVISGTVAFLFYEVNATSISYVALNLASSAATWTLPTSVTSITAYNGLGYDVSPSSFSASGKNYFLIAWSQANGVYLTFMQQTGNAGVTLSQNTHYLVSVATAATTACAIRWDPANTRCWVASSYLSTGTNYIGGLLLNVTFAPTAFTVTPAYAYNNITTYAPGSQGTYMKQLAVEDRSSGGTVEAVVAWNVGPGAGPQANVSHVGWGSLTGTSSGAFVGTLAWSTQMISKLFAVATPDALSACRVYGVVATVQAQETHVLVEFDPTGYAVTPHPAATLAPRLTLSTGLDLRGRDSLSDVTNYGNRTAGTYHFASVLSETQNAPANYAVFGGALNFQHPARSQAVQVGQLTYVAGGVSSTFDGSSCVEQSTIAQMAQGGEIALTGSATGGSLENNVTYVYVWVPEWRDDLGIVHQGQPSDQIACTIPPGAGAAGSVSGNVPCLSLTNQGPLQRRVTVGQAPMYLVPYRSLYQNGAMSVYPNLYRLVGDNPGAGYANIPDTAQTIAFTDTAPDATLQNNALLPTDGGVLEADCPSSFAAICEHNSRVYGIGDDLRTVWISTAQADGIPCYFNDGSQAEVSFLGDLVALWSQDQNLIYASATGLAYSQGSGPNITGAQNDLTPPVQIPSDVGCVDPRAWCVTPQGTVFRTRYGLALLDRSLAVHSDFGDPVTALLQQFPTVTAMALHPTRPELLITAQAANGLGTVLVYNYRFGAWSSWTLIDPNSFATLGINAAIVSQGALYLLASNGALYREKVSTDAVQFFDTAQGTSLFVPLSASLGWVKNGGVMQGLGWIHNIQVGFVNQDWSDLEMLVYYDYNTANPSVYTWTGAQIAAFYDVANTLGTETEVSLKPQYSRGTAFRVVIADAPSTTTPTTTSGQGPRITVVSCELEPFEGARRLPGAQRG